MEAACFVYQNPEIFNIKFPYFPHQCTGSPVFTDVDTLFVRIMVLYTSTNRLTFVGLNTPLLNAACLFETSLLAVPW